MIQMGMNQSKQFFRESDHPLAELWRERVDQNRDLTILITDSSNDRGTGKTTLALKLAHGMDRSDDGLTENKVAMDPHPLIKAYRSQPKGSSLVLDESEVGLDKYQAGSAVNRAIRELVSIGRVREHYLVLNAPADHLVDKDLKSLVDVWILVERRGFANVYRQDWNPHEGHPLTPPLGTIEWDAITPQSHLNGVYEYLGEEKDKRIDGEEGTEYIQRERAQDMVDQATKETKQEIRDELIRSMKATGLTNKRVAEITDLSASRVSQIANSTGD